MAPFQRLEILLVEDDEAAAAAFLEVMEAEGLDASGVAVAPARDEAVAAIRERAFDYVICDLWIPPHAGSIQVAREHGFFVVERLQAEAPGTPCAILTGLPADDRPVRARIASGGTDDLYGSGQMVALLDLWQKRELLQCVRALKAVETELRSIDECRCIPEDDAQLEGHALRVVQIFARRRGGESVRVRRLGGLSKTQAVRVEVRDARDRVLASVFAKVGPRHLILDERNRYQNLVAVQLGATAFPPFADAVMAGAGKTGGNFYSLTLGFEASLFGWIKDTGDDGVEIVRRLRACLAEWKNQAFEDSFVVGELRRAHVTDEILEASVARGEGRWACRACEDVVFPAPSWPQHGDLHGENVMIGGGGQPIVVDFADVARRVCVYDPVVLELSLVFHPRSPARSSGWPTVQEAEAWTNLEEYSERSPCANLVRACRLWALETGGELSTYAAAYAHALRQVKYDDTDHALAWSIAEAAGRRVRELKP